MVKLDGESLTLKEAKQIANGAKLSLDKGVRVKVEAARKCVIAHLNEGKRVYGVTTGFGYLARCDVDQRKSLQENILKSHAAGWGESLTLPEVRLAMALRLNVLAKGYTGVRYKICTQLLQLIQAEIYPVIPRYGSVGASGDLAPLAHLALPLIGLGEVFFQGKRMAARRALKQAGMMPLKLEEKEGLSLVNGTQVMLSVGGLSLLRAETLLEEANEVAGVTLEALDAWKEAFDPKIQKVRGQVGQVTVARRVRALFSGGKKTIPQDPYSLRCIPQVHGATEDVLQFALGICERELNAATDNPLVFAKEGKILSGGNFHGQPLALAFDTAAMGIAELGNISERRLELLLNPKTSDLPPFLTPHEGVCSGYMALQYLAASLVNENKVLSHPACTDSIPGNLGVEDHVSMGMTAANKLKKMVENVKVILACELLAACQACDLKGKRLKGLYQKVRQVVPHLDHDRIVADDIRNILEVLHG